MASNRASFKAFSTILSHTKVEFHIQHNTSHPTKGFQFTSHKFQTNSLHITHYKFQPKSVYITNHKSKQNNQKLPVIENEVIYVFAEEGEVSAKWEGS